MTYRAWEQKPLDRTAVRELTAAIAEQAAAQLEEQAMDEAPWSDEKYKAVLAAQQKENALLAGILAARGITDPAEALTLLAGEEELSDPALLTDMDAACQRIWQAIDNGETIAVFGDYDVDGVTATALLYQHLKGMGATVKCMLPSREGDGYGLSKYAIQSMHNKGCTLIVTVDNGISAVEEADFAASLGMDLIITDHHLPPETLPKAVAVVDPRREDDHSPFKGLCGAGVAFKLCAALDGCPPEEMLEYCGDLAAVGTVADVMPLTGENRTIVKAGLRQLQNTDRPGFCALLEEVGLAGKPVTAENISYAIAPRLNAAGRMDSAVTALQLVLCEDEDRAVELAHKLSDINIQRQETEMEIVKAAQELLDARSTYGGTGLGMPIAKALIDAMGGTIEFTSRQGEGTTYYITLPFAVDHAAAPQPLPGAPADLSALQGKHILLAEDNDLNLEIAEFLLQNAGLRTTAARNGQEAVTIFTASAPGTFDAILMDVMMPLLDGYEATRAIRALDRPDAAAIPIFAMTANAFTEDRRRAYDSGMNEHLTKPLEPDTLLRTLAKYLQR